MKWKPVDVIALMLAFTMAVGVIVTVLTPLWFNEPLSDKRSETLSTVVDSLLSILAVYVGYALRGVIKDDQGCKDK